MTDLAILHKGLDPIPESIQQILSAVRSHLGMMVGFVSEFTNGRRVFRHIDSEPGISAPIAVGDGDPLEESYCHWIVEGKLPQLIRDPRDFPLTQEFAATESLPVGAHLSVPIQLSNGEVYGTFCCFSFEPDHSLTERDLATMRAFAALAAAQIQAGADREANEREIAARIGSTLSEQAIDIHFQPAVRLDSPKIAFLEALARFHRRPYRSPDEWFADAHEVGLGVELELLAARLALRHLPSFPAGTSLSINMSPLALMDRETLALLNSAPLDRLIIEITEHSAVANYAALCEAIQPLRNRGLRLAVDDAGAGYASLKHILQIAPDIIKLDMSLSRGIHRDAARRALAAALIHFAKATGSELVAEGVESAAELKSLRDLGIMIIQGHLFARPAPAGELQIDAAAA